MNAKTAATEPPANAGILSEAEAAARLFCKASTLRKWRGRQTGPPYLKLSGKILYQLADIEAFLAASRVVPQGNGRPMKLGARRRTRGK